MWWQFAYHQWHRKITDCEGTDLLISDSKKYKLLFFKKHAADIFGWFLSDLSGGDFVYIGFGKIDSKIYTKEILRFF